VAEAALHRDGVEALRDFGEPPGGLDAVPLSQLILEDRRGGEGAVSGAAELGEQGAVLELRRDRRPDALGVEPVRERPAQRRALGRDQEARAVEGAREARSQASGLGAAKIETDDSPSKWL